MILLEIAALGIFTYLLVKGTEWVVRGIVELAQISRMGKFGVATLMLALATSLPEFFVGVGAALEGQPNLSLGNVLGSNIANVSLIIGVAAMIGGSVPVMGEYLRRDFGMVFIIGMLPVLLMFDGQIGRADGLILVLLYGAYMYSVLRKRHVEGIVADKAHMRVRYLRRLVVWTDEGHRRVIGHILVGLATLLMAAELVVRMGSILAADLHVPILLVGLFMVAVGTSLPELVVEIQAIRKREVALVFGNLLGSNVANATLILGVTALLAPMTTPSRRPYVIAAITYGVVFGAFWLLTRTKRRLDRWEGGVLVAIYLIFVAVEWLRENGWGEWFTDLLQR